MISIVFMSIDFFLKDIAIPLLFTEEFYPVRKLFLWQLIGAAWLLFFPMIAKAMTKRYIFLKLFHL